MTVPSLKPKIVVVTPVKNEAWIIDRFLAVSSQFADYIIIADQNSTDESVAICKKYPKVILIKNEADEYDEPSRQILLIQTARELVPEHKIILALDADEILAANAMQTLGWQSMLKAKPGTILCFEKPELYVTPNQCIRYQNTWPLGYVDDGVDYKPTSKVHSFRIPLPEYAPRLHIHNVKILHYALTRIDGQNSKIRLYSVLENAFKTRSLLDRRRFYPADKDSKRIDFEPCPREWFNHWEEIGIDMQTIIGEKYYWHDFEVLKYFQKYGLKRFWLDEIWNFDWEACRVYAKSINLQDIPDYKIAKPPSIINLILKKAQAILRWTRKKIV